MELVTDNNTYTVIFEFESIYLIDENNNKKNYNTFRLPKNLQNTIKKWYNQYLENLLPTTKFKNNEIKSYIHTNALRVSLTFRQRNIIMTCLKYERKRNTIFDFSSNNKKHYIYDRPKTGKSMIPLELSKYKMSLLDNFTNADTNIILCPNHLISQWIILLKTIYKGRYLVIDSIQKLNKCLVYGPIKNKSNKIIVSKNKVKKERDNLNYINQKSKFNHQIILNDNKFINPYILENTDIILITPQMYHEFKTYFYKSDYDSISRLFVDSCFDLSILDFSTTINEIRIHHTYYITNNFNYLVNNNFKYYHWYTSKILKNYHIKRMEYKHGNCKIFKDKLDIMKSELEQLIIFSHDSIPNEINYVDISKFILKFRINDQIINENIVNLIKNEKYSEIIHIFKLKIHNIDKLVNKLSKNKYNSSVIERVQNKDNECPICLVKIDVTLLTNCCFNKLCLKCYILSQKETKKCPCCRTKSVLDNQYIIESDKISCNILKSNTISNLISNSKYKSRSNNLLDIISFIASKDKFLESKFIIVINYHQIRNVNELVKTIIDFNKFIKNYTSMSCSTHNWKKEIDNFNFTPKYNCLIMRHTNYTYLINSGYNFVNLNHVISYNFELDDIHIPKIIKRHKNQSNINYFEISK